MELMKAVRLIAGSKETAKPRSIRRDGGKERDFLFPFRPWQCRKILLDLFKDLFKTWSKNKNIYGNSIRQ